MLAIGLEGGRKHVNKVGARAAVTLMTDFGVRKSLRITVSKGNGEVFNHKPCLSSCLELVLGIGEDNSRSITVRHRTRLPSP